MCLLLLRSANHLADIDHLLNIIWNEDDYGSCDVFHDLCLKAF